MQKAKWLALGALCSGLGLATVQPAQADEESSGYRPFSVGADISTLGFGASASWRFHDHLGVRAGINYFSYSDDGKEIEGVSYNTDFNWMSVPVGVDIYPWAQKTFRISLGVLLNQNEIEAVMPQSGVAGTFVPIGSGFYQTSDFSLRMTAEQEAVSPYFSIGASIFLDKAKRWALNGEIGVAYTGTPDVTLVNAGPGAINPADLAQEQRDIEDWTEKMQFYPIVKVGLSFSF